MHSDDSNLVLTTEGHLLTMDRSLEKPITPIRRELRRVEHLSCPVYKPTVLSFDRNSGTGITASIYSRRDVDYVRALMSAPSTGSEEYVWSPDGWCQIPKVDLYVGHFLMWRCATSNRCRRAMILFSPPTARRYRKISHQAQTSWSPSQMVTSFKMFRVSVPISLAVWTARGTT